MAKKSPEKPKRGGGRKKKMIYKRDDLVSHRDNLRQKMRQINSLIKGLDLNRRDTIQCNFRIEDSLISVSDAIADMFKFMRGNTAPDLDKMWNILEYPNVPIEEAELPQYTVKISEKQ